ncbi:hypothetical protein TIFTF001_035349 [Ficus carica]|uniref:Uncharacterized protein n=1 Tax=Ficus carica TaxID=3494 RepID=A0AA88E1E9_FICCA|nr:hypothetical protein TIFTF001_035308 [Ficus carica]GMN66261.1 hypothetical protein TIFTF001_035325 [Ficus carica]GMN66266.1 hypothetical protein TIFTF001_035332 [Ficus carica]GMN66285.1 hypothetical protein TIFTF001_035349 [Ficus carica]
METLKKPHAAILASPGLGHLIPVVELAKRLVVHHNLAVTIFAIPSHSSPAEVQLLQSAMSPKLFGVVELPQPDISSQVSPDAAVVTCLAVMMRTCRPALRSAISSMENRPNLLIVDLFGTDSLSIARSSRFPIKGEYVDQKERLRIPGCRSLRPQDVVDQMLERVINSTGSICVLRSDPGKRRHFGEYVVRSAANDIGGAEKRQPLGQYEQTTELAWGLELSHQRFIWVVRPPTASADAAFFTVGESSDDPSAYLPEGFMSRTRDLGRVISMWAEQAQILSHPSRMIAEMLTEELGVAVGPEELPTKRVVAREEIEKMVRKIMVDKEGCEIRARVKEVKRSANKALSEEGGSSYVALSRFAKQCCKSNIKS